LCAFPVGFWNYVDIANQDASAVRDWADAGMTLTMGPNYGPAAAEVKKMRRILDAAHEAGIRVILGDRRTPFTCCKDKGEAAYASDAKAAIKAIGKHPAIFGLHIGDEPGTEHFHSACRAMRIVKELAPHQTPFHNLLPWYQGVHTRVGFADWGEYLDTYTRESGCEFLCYDCYSQMNPGSEGWDMYFRNLNEFHAAARRNGIPFWTTLLSVGHFRYRCPKEDDLRWQLNTALAHGAKGILWFFFYMRAPHCNYRVPPVDEHCERTETYEWLSRVCRTFLKSTAPVLENLTLRRVAHVGTSWGGTPGLDPSGRIARAVSQQGTPIIVSEFDGPNESEWVMVVNNSQTDSTYANIVVRGRKPTLGHVRWMGAEAKLDAKNPGEVNACAGEDYISADMWLAPGQMELFRVEGHDA